MSSFDTAMVDASVLVDSYVVVTSVVPSASFLARPMIITGVAATSVSPVDPVAVVE